MALLQIVQRFCERNGLHVPLTVYGSTETQVIQIKALLEEEGNDLARRHAWEGITFEASHTSVATESQGAISTIANNGFRYIKNGTFWDRTNDTPITGPLTDKEWQASKVLSLSGPHYRYRLRGGNLLINPVPAAGYSWYFEYVSKNWILGADGVTYKQYFTLDTDTVLLPEDLVLAGLRWRWKKEKGLEYAEDFRTYETQIKEAMGHDGGKHTIDMNGSQGDAVPGVFVPQGNWSLP